MKLQVVGCSHHASSVDIRQRLAFDDAQARLALHEVAPNLPLPPTTPDLTQSRDGCAPVISFPSMSLSHAFPMKKRAITSTA